MPFLTHVIPAAGETPPPALAELAHRAADYARQTSAASTRAAYAKDWRDFENWCAAMHLDALPAAPATVGTYLADLAGRLAVATLTRRLAAISTAHRLAGHRLDTRHPAIHDLMRGIRRAHGTRQRRVAPATTTVVQAMAATCDDSLLDLRDRALLLLGFAAALRRGEIVALDASDIAVVAEGLRIAVRRSKMDQDGAGELVGVVRTGTATCPVAAVQAWLAAAAITEGRAFRAVDRHGRVGAALSDQTVALIVKRRAALVGLDATDFAGHSLRAGLATAAATNGVEERIIMRQTRHVGTTVRRYIRDGEMFVGNASGRVGL
jgi:integrase